MPKGAFICYTPAKEDGIPLIREAYNIVVLDARGNDMRQMLAKGKAQFIATVDIGTPMLRQ